jgi:LysM repeat protein
VSIDREQDDRFIVWVGGLIVAAAAVFWLVVFASAVGGSSGSEGAQPAPTATSTATVSATATASPTGTATEAPEQTYTVQAGDTLSGIAIRFSISVADLAAANGITDPSTLEVGQVLTIPAADD